MQNDSDRMRVGDDMISCRKWMKKRNYKITILEQGIDLFSSGDKC